LASEVQNLIKSSLLKAASIKKTSKVYTKNSTIRKIIGARDIFVSQGEYLAPAESYTTERKLIDPKFMSISPKQYEGMILKIHPKTSPTVLAVPPKILKTKTMILTKPPITKVKK
jgi:hypothetical protein